jgi:hypothetical protein
MKACPDPDNARLAENGLPIFVIGDELQSRECQFTVLMPIPASEVRRNKPIAYLVS